MARALVAALVALLLATPIAHAHGRPGGPHTAHGHGLPLGPPSLPETRTVDRLAPGLTYTKIVRGQLSPDDGWTVDAAVVASAQDAQTEAQRLRAAGFDAETSALPGPPDLHQPGPFAYRVRSGLFATKAEADARVAAIAAAGIPVRGSVFTAEDGGPTTGPWVVHVLSVDPRRFQGDIAPTLSNDVVVDREKLSSMSARHGALAGINGGYFVIGAADGTPGDLAGSSILDGQLVSEAVDGRTDLLLDHGNPIVGALADAQTVTASDGATRVLDGDNRAPGLIRACGGTGGDLPTERPLHDITCTDPGELIEFAPIFGAPTPSGDGVEAVLDRTGAVTAVRTPRGGPIPPGGSVLAGTGDAAEWLNAHAKPGARLRIGTRVQTERGPLWPHRGLDVVNGGPRLLRGGREDIDAEAEGFDHPGDVAFWYAFGLRRNPRTIAGTTRNHKLLLVAVDGRAPGYSAGLSFAEEAAVLRALGAKDAVNLDGGGSTTMTIRGTVVTRPSDATGERPIGDAILFEPR